MKSKSFVFAVIILCSGLILSADQTLPRVKKLPGLDLNSGARLKPAGEYVISLWKGDRFEEVGRLAYDKFLREQELDLSPYLAGMGAAKVRISEEGPGAAHIDCVLLGGQPPAAAEGRDAGRVLKKLSVRDNDVVNAQGENFVLAFAGNTADKTLRLAARIEAASVGTAAFQFPTDNLFTRIGPHSRFYSYSLNSSAPPPGQVGSEEYLQAIGQRRPFFRVYSPTSSGHPAGTTYGWVSNDAHSLYVTLDFTPDNTYDGDKDYAQVFVRVGEEVRDFKVSVPETKWGTAHFTYTDKVAYEHKVYDFVIPLSELGRSGEAGKISLAFAAYGTASVYAQNPSLAFDPDHKRYLLVFEVYGGESDIAGVLLDKQGEIIPPSGGGEFFAISLAEGYQVFPDVAYDSASGRFLVVWQDGRDIGSQCYDIYGQMLNSDGSLYGSDFVIATGGDCQDDPAVANDSNQHQFLVVWSQDDLEGDDILGQFVGGNGNLIPPGWADARPQARADVPSNFIICDDWDNQWVPDVAFDGLANEYLVVFQSERFADGEYTTNEINGQFVSWNGRPLYHETDVNFLISDPFFQAVHPAIANDNVNHRFLVAWADFPWDIFDSPRAQAEQQALGSAESRWRQGTRALPPNPGARLKHTTHQGGGQPQVPGAVRPQSLQKEEAEKQPFIYGQLVDTSANLIYEWRFLVSDTSEELPDWLYLNQNNPAVAFNSFDQTYLAINYVYWWDNEYYEGGIDFGGRLLNAAGEVVSEWIELLDYWWDAYDPEPYLAPAVAYNSYCRNFLAAWPCYCGEIHREIVGPEECLNLPEVWTTAITDITTTSAKSGGNVTSDGGAEVAARGVCWNTGGGPTTHDSLTTDGSGLGTFASQLTGLSPGTKYYVRAYATNVVGTAYGNELAFTTLRQFKVTFVAGPGGTVSGTLVQYVVEGGDCTPVEAKADVGSCFIIWTGTTGFASTSANPLTVTNVQQDMTITANFGNLTLAIEKLTEEAWIIKRFYAKVVLSVDGLDPAVPIKYVLNRKASGGEYKSLKEFSSGDLQNNTFTYEDKFLEAEVTYVYQVVAYNASNQAIGWSQEITVK